MLANSPNDRIRLLLIDHDLEYQQLFSHIVAGAYQVSLAIDSAEGLRALQNEGPFGAVFADRRCDGIALLSETLGIWPTTSRVLVTGAADVETLVSAINQARIFRVLIKPSPNGVVLRTVHDAVEQHRVVAAERQTIEQTVQGAVKTLGDLLAIANPAAYGRATRVRTHVGNVFAFLATKAQPAPTAYGYGRPRASGSFVAPIADRWEVETAAALSQIGCVGLPPATSEKFYYGKAMSPAEWSAASRVPQVGARLLSGIPRFDGVRKLLHYQTKNFDGSGQPPENISGDSIPWGARVLRIAVDFDVLESQGKSRHEALETLRKRPDWYDRTIIEVFAQAIGQGRDEVIRFVEVDRLQAGTIFAEDVISKTGVLLAARGIEVTPTMLQKIQSTWQGLLAQPIKVIMKEARRR